MPVKKMPDFMVYYFNSVYRMSDSRDHPVKSQPAAAFRCIGIDSQHVRQTAC